MKIERKAMTKMIPVIIVYLLFCLKNSLNAHSLYRANKLVCPLIKTSLGDIAGIREQTVLGNSSFCSYRGIRYAEAPIGELRFKVSI